MEIKTFRAKTMQQALALVRSEFGPQATVLHTRELNAGLVKRMLVGRRYEIAASPPDAPEAQDPSEPATPTDSASVDFSAAYRDRYRNDLRDAPGGQLAELQALVHQLRGEQVNVSQAELPTALFDLFTDLIDADVDEQTAREMIEQLRQDETIDFDSPLSARAKLVMMIEHEITASGPLIAGDTSTDRHQAARFVALVGPTGVGKTTTIAKLAANYRLRAGKRVGLITVDTYRIAAVEQLRTYADIIDLPMEVVSTPREMREAVNRMRSLDLVLIDTAGRSPRDEVKIQELRAMLAEAAADEVHLVLSAVASSRSITAVAERFAPAGVTSLLVTKLDEAASLGNLLSLARNQELPFSYLTDGQNVPDDIRVAEPRELAQLILGAPSRALPCNAAKTLFRPI